MILVEQTRCLNHNLPLVKRTLQKDSTASGQQHMFKVLGQREGAFFMCNIDSPAASWQDTYAYIIKTFRETLTSRENNEDIVKYFTRKHLKNAIMTHSYAATFFTQRSVFLDNIKTQFKLEYGTDYASAYALISLQKQVKTPCVSLMAPLQIAVLRIERLFKKFNKFLEDAMEDLFYLKKSSCIVD